MDEISIYIRWDMKADSFNGVPSILSIHQTLEGARAAISEDILKYSRKPFGNYIENYAYEAIEERKVGL